MTGHDILVCAVAFAFGAGSIIGATILVQSVQSVWGVVPAIILANVLSTCIVLMMYLFIKKHI